MAAEVIGISTGLLGLVPLAAKGYRIIHSAFRTARACTLELRGIEVDFGTQECRFLNECEHLLRLTDTGDHVVRDMVDNPNHPSWSDDDINRHLQRTLSRNYEACCSIVESMQDLQGEIESKLQCFEIVRKERAKDESLRTTFRRLREARKIVFDKSWYEEKIDTLRTRIQDLKEIRMDLETFHKYSTSHCLSCPSHKPLPQRIEKLHNMSEEAYQALATAFPCEDQSHTDHWTAICVDCDSGEPGCLDVVLTYGTTSNSFKEENSLRFLLQARQVEELTTLPISESMSPQQQDCTVDVPAHEQTRGAMKLAAFSELAKLLQKGKRKAEGLEMAVRQRPAPPTSDEPSPEPACDAAAASRLEGLGINLCHVGNACQHLVRTCENSAREARAEYARYFRSSQLCRYAFYVSCRRHATYEQVGAIWAEPKLSLKEFLDGQYRCNIVDQLKIALRLTLAVLQFHSTPWLDKEWRISDMLLVDEQSSDRQVFLRSNLPASRLQPNRYVSAMGDTKSNEETSNVVTLQDLVGINNYPLFSLGVALLEIGHKKSLASLRQESDSNDIITARRVAKQNTGLGGKYDKMVEMCLRGTLASSVDLNEAELQRAVYNMVACPLEELIEKLGAFTF
ncbi:hypothetical protein B0J13DRAFT_515756 [Dactylonectria estremocensis]|uniref:DUF7580 domain-containing protein n=1 Tax=Dactylonectria estremocensis TaxID=1079267 RepID=A0A9P9D4M0_9HYPO|nr:hypothetical protein B0J13DRAFT_515756 [Dactylonectria estremocensis]